MNLIERSFQNLLGKEKSTDVQIEKSFQHLSYKNNPDYDLNFFTHRYEKGELRLPKNANEAAGFIDEIKKEKESLSSHKGDVEKMNEKISTTIQEKLKNNSSENNRIANSLKKQQLENEEYLASLENHNNKLNSLEVRISNMKFSEEDGEMKKAFDNLLQRDLDKQDRYNEESAKYLLNNPDKNIVNVSESKPSVLSVEDAFRSIDRSDNVKSRQLSNAASNLNKLFSANVEDKQEEAKTPVRIRERKQDPLSKGIEKEKPSSCKGEIQDVLDKINGGEEIVLDDENSLKATNLQTLSHHITNLVSKFREPEKVRISYVLNGIKQDDNLESLMKRLDVQFKVISEKDVKETITPETLQKYGVSGLENDVILSKNKTPLDLNSFTILKLNDLEDDKFNSQSSVDYSKYEIVKSVTKDSEDEHSNNPTIEDVSIVGSTQTGKDIHTSRPASHGFYKGWTSQDHQDASDILMGLRGPDDAVANSHSLVSQNLRNGILS